MNNLEPIKCKSCGAPLKTETVDERTGCITCEYCGSETQWLDPDISIDEPDDDYEPFSFPQIDIARVKIAIRVTLIIAIVLSGIFILPGYVQRLSNDCPGTIAIASLDAANSSVPFSVESTQPNGSGHLGIQSWLVPITASNTYPDWVIISANSTGIQIQGAGTFSGGSCR